MVSFCMIANEESLWPDVMLQKSPRVDVETIALGSDWLCDLHCKALTAKGVPHYSSSLYNMQMLCMGLHFSQKQNRRQFWCILEMTLD